MVSSNAERRVTLIPEFLTTYEQANFSHDITKYIGDRIFVSPDKFMADTSGVNPLGAGFFLPFPGHKTRKTRRFANCAYYTTQTPTRSF